MNKNRLEAFSDGVIAIIITIMVLELKVPHNPDCTALIELLPVFSCYALSFAFIGVYWVNHHHLLHTAKRVTPAMMWANLNLLFWLSLVPFGTAWMGESHFVAFPVSMYSALLLVCGTAYVILQKTIEKTTEHSTLMKHAMQISSKKGTLSTIGYISAIFLAYVNTAISETIFVLVAVMWFIPDKNIERALREE